MVVTTFAAMTPPRCASSAALAAIRLATDAFRHACFTTMLDGSAFLNHGRPMERAFNSPIPRFETVPVMYQGASDDFLGPFADVTLRSEAHGIDFAGEFGVVLGPVPMACAREDALVAVRLIVQIQRLELASTGAARNADRIRLPAGQAVHRIRRGRRDAG